MWGLNTYIQRLPPITYIQEIMVLQHCNVVKPDTFNDDNKVALLFDVVKPEAFKLVICNDEKH